MILHLGVIFGAAPLLALSLCRVGLAPRTPGPAWAAAAALGELAVVWSWHLPALHAAAALVPSYFALQQSSFLVAGAMVWLPGMSAGRASEGAGTLAVFMSAMHMSMLGVLLVTAPVLLYAPEICGGAWGLSPLDDQRLGGALMAVVGGLGYFGAATVCAWRMLANGRGAGR